MAARARALVQRMWREGDWVDRYVMIGGVTGSVVGMGVGGMVVLTGSRAGESAAAAVTAGLFGAALWPLAVAWGVVYVPLKVLEMATQRHE